MEIALPSFLFQEENSMIVMAVFFFGFICVPIALVYKQYEPSFYSANLTYYSAKQREMYFRNGLLNESRRHMIK